MQIAGIIEGFYGDPWSWAERAEVMRWCHDRGMSDYVYAPKDDPKHRERWREPYGSETLRSFGRLVEENTLRVGFGISPGLSIDYQSAEDRHSLLEKIEQVVTAGVSLVVLALDDIPFGGEPLGISHAALSLWLHDQLAGRAELVLVPTEYVGSAPTPYLAALAEGVPEDVLIAWTGAKVVNAAITAEEAVERAGALGGRAPLLWDNYPVNDAMMADRLHLGPLWGRDPDLRAACSGYLANPMVQALASRLPLASTAAWLQGADPLDAWASAADELDARVLAEACDGAVPGALVATALEWLDDEQAAVHLAPLRDWLEAAARCDEGRLGTQVAPWVAQVREEAKVGLAALRLIDHVRSGEHAAVVGAAFAAMMGAGALRASRHTVLGPRWSYQPALGQRPDGTWSLGEESLLEAANAVDDLVRAAVSYASQC